MKTRRNKIEDFIASLHDASLSEAQTAFLFTTGGNQVLNDGCYNYRCTLNSGCPNDSKGKKHKSSNFMGCHKGSDMQKSKRNEKCVFNVGRGCINSTDNCKPLKI